MRLWKLSTPSELRMPPLVNKVYWQRLHIGTSRCLFLADFAESARGNVTKSFPTAPSVLGQDLVNLPFSYTAYT
jgi:hypothetical protein